MSLADAFLATLKGRRWSSGHHSKPDLTGEDVIAVYRAIQCAASEGRNADRDIIAVFPGALSLSGDRRIDKALQRLRSMGLIEWRRASGWRPVAVNLGGALSSPEAAASPDLPASPAVDTRRQDTFPEGPQSGVTPSDPPSATGDLSPKGFNGGGLGRGRGRHE